MLGEPGKGFHEARIFGLARNDTVATILVAALTSWFAGVAFWKALLGWFIIGEILHYLFGTPTAFLTMTGLARAC